MSKSAGGMLSHKADELELTNVGSFTHSDDDHLARLGKKSVLKRNFGFMSILGFSCTVVITWEAFLIVFAQAFYNGGPSGVLYGYLFVWLGTFCVFVTLAEACSMAPTSGGQYHWVSMLAPPKSQKFLSYITGWFTVLGWQAFTASVGYLNGGMIVGLITLTDSSSEYKPVFHMLAYWGVILFGVLINTVVSSWLPKFEGFILILHILGFFAIIFPLVILGPHAPPKDVFSTFSNGGKWPTQTLSVFVGLIGPVYAFFGVDGAIHMAEEIQNAAKVVPRAIIFSVILNGLMGLGMALSLLFCIGDAKKAINTKTKFPFIEIFQQAVQSTTGAALMTSIVITLSLCATVGIVATASRQLWAFSRDRAVPGWQKLQRVNSKTAVPVTAVFITTLISILLSVIIIGSVTAFNDIVSLSVTGLFGSYLMVACLLFYRRVRGHIKPYASSETALTNIAGAQLTWGPWRFFGWFGYITNAFAIIYLIIIFFFVTWPPDYHVHAYNMNYSSVMLGGTMAFATAWYWIKAKKEYKGPVIEINH